MLGQNHPSNLETLSLLEKAGSGSWRALPSGRALIAGFSGILTMQKWGCGLHTEPQRDLRKPTQNLSPRSHLPTHCTQLGTEAKSQH